MIQTLKKILYILPQGDRFKLFILFIMMLVGALVEVIGVGMIPAFVSIVASPDAVFNLDLLIPVWETFGINNSEDLLVFGAITLIVVFVIKNAYIVFYNYIKARFVYSRFLKIGSNLFKHYMYAPYEFHLNRNSAELLRNVTQEALHVASQVITPMLKLGMDFLLVLMIFVMLFVMEPLITLGSFILLGLGGMLFMKSIKEKTSRYGKIAQDDRKMMIKSVNEGLGGFKDARVLKREEWFYLRFYKHARSFSISQTFWTMANEAGKPVIQTIAVSGMLLITLFMYWQGRELEVVIPVLTLFGAATIRIMPAVQGITQSISTLRYYSYTIEPIYNDTIEMVNSKVSSDDLPVKKLNEHAQIINFTKEIKFENVSYHYPGTDIQAVRNLTLSIPKGYAVGFVGASGAGKTTLVDLLLGLLRPNRGSIKVDDIDINENLPSWQKTVGYIPQFIFLADDTIKRNIAFGLPDENIEDERLYLAIETAQLSSFIQELPDGVNTVIGERGTRLSGGQRQRIGIARALYHHPQVLIMDEATSALDNLTEKYVVTAIERLKGDRSIIIIAHRLTTVQNCDRLYLMDRGYIVDSGSYKELLERNKDFKRMAFVD